MTYFLVNENGSPQEIIEDDIKNIKSINAKYTSRSIGYESLQDLYNHLGVDPNFKCLECNGLITTKCWIQDEREILIKNQLCFGCYHWQKIVESLSDPRIVIINGISYYRNDFKLVKDPGLLGFGGAIWNIKMNSGQIFKTNDLWYQGEIPDRFKYRLKDNATFIAEMELPK